MKATQRLESRCLCSSCAAILAEFHLVSIIVNTNVGKEHYHQVMFLTDDFPIMPESTTEQPFSRPAVKKFSAACVACQKSFATRPSYPFSFRPSYRRRHPTFGQYRSDMERARLGDGGKRKTECRRRAKTGRTDKPVCGLTCHVKGREKKWKVPGIMEKTAKGSELIRSRQSGSRTDHGREGEGRITETMHRSATTTAGRKIFRWQTFPCDTEAGGIFSFPRRFPLRVGCQR